MYNDNSINMLTVKGTITLWLFMYLVLFTAFLFPGQGEYGFYSVEWSFFFWAAILIYGVLLVVLKKGVFSFRTDPVLILIAVFFLMVLLSIVDAPNKFKGILYSGQFIPYFFLMYFTILIVTGEKKLIKVVDMMIFLALVFCLTAIVVAIVTGRREGLNDFLLNTFNIGVLKVISFTTFPLSILLSRILNERATPYRLFTFLMITIAIVLTGSRGNYLIWALIIFLSVIKARSFKKKVMILSIAGIIVIIGFLTMDYVLQRIQLLAVTSSEEFNSNITAFSRLFTAKVALNLMIQHPFNGIGIGNLSYFMQSAISQTPGIPTAILRYWEQSQLYETQTTPLKLGAEIGMGGFIFFFAFYYYLWKRIKKSYYISPERIKVILDGIKIAIIADFLHNFVDVSFYNYYSWFYYGIIIAVSRIDYEKKTNNST
jgi:hypothetical protein